MPDMPPKLPSFSVNLTGDVMLGRLIDQLRPTHVSNTSDAQHIAQFIRSNPNLKNYSAKSPWGNTLPLFHSSDLNIINLETSVTTHPVPWPGKMFNYRMHPSNVDFLKEARVRYASLANNHSLDFSEEGLVETAEALDKEEISFAGAGRTREEALRPAKLFLRHQSNENDKDGKDGREYEVHVYSASDHPRDWSSIPGFHLIEYSTHSRTHLRSLLNSDKTPKAALKIFSVHWGPNYSWHPSDQIRSLAHFLIDECGIDVIHGHSSHHVQGVEVYKGKLIIYGCGDFVDDYAVDGTFRNDISALWRLAVAPRADAGENMRDQAKTLRPSRLEMYPTRCRRFVTDRLEKNDPDFDWVKEKLVELSGEYGTNVKVGEREDGKPMFVVDLPVSKTE